MKKLKYAQEELIEAGRLTSLGELVGGVAHEINTPLGITVTAISYLAESIKSIKAAYENQTMTQEEFSEFLNDAEEGCSIITSNVNKSADLVKSFKKIAVDQTSEHKRLFNLPTYINDVFTSLKPVLKKHPGINIQVSMDSDLSIESSPGLYSQIITILVMNSLTHGFEDQAEGEIVITAKKMKYTLLFEYKDNGSGLDKTGLKKLFDPFYTTKRGLGGSGLGTHILYNLVKRGLSGTIEADSSPGQGLQYSISIPV